MRSWNFFYGWESRMLQPCMSDFLAVGCRVWYNCKKKKGAIQLLTLLNGTDRTVLTEEIFACAAKAAQAGCDGQIVIVPEQFSHEAERKLCEAGGDSISRFAQVLSFSRLCDRLAAVQGGSARTYLDKGGQLLAMALAAEQVSSRIKLFAAVLRKPEFLADLVKMIGEFQSYCLQPDSLLQAAKEEEGQFAQKLEELGLLYEAYLAVCANLAADPADKLVFLRRALVECDWARTKTVYVDGFSDFTGAELAVLALLVQECRQVVVSVPRTPDGSAMEHLGKEQLMLLRRMAEQTETACAVRPMEPGTHRSEAVQFLLDHLFTACPVTPQASAAVQLHAFSSIEEECRSAVLYLKKLLLQGNRCRDISIACTDPSRYDAPLRAAFRSAALPAYFAGETDILAHPVVAAVIQSLFAAAGPMDYEDVALYLKSELPILERDRRDRLDNYAYLWNLRGTQWEKPWSLHPRGFAEAWTQEDRQLLEALNTDRQIVLEPLLALRRRVQTAKNTGEMVLALHSFLETLELRQRLEQQANDCAAKGQGQLAQELLQIYEALVGAMEQTWLTLGQTQRTPEDFGKLYQMLLTQYRVASIPAGLDQVHVSSLPDLRHRKTKHLLVLGAADGSFPSYKTSEGLLTEQERRRLLEQGISMAPGRADRLDQEMAGIYFALSAAEESIWMSYAGEQPAWLFRRAAAMVTGGAGEENGEVFLNLSELAACRLRRGEEQPLELPGLEEAQTALKQRRDYSFTALREQTVKHLYGSPIVLSASKIDRYASCRFGYFMQYGLKAKPRKQAKLDQPAFGTFVHAVLEHTVRRVQDCGGFCAAAKEEVLQIALEEIEAYASELFPEQAEREAYLFRRSQAEVLDIVEDLWEELRGSGFQPEFCELKFAADGQLPLIHIPGKREDCLITGSIDRVDLYEEAGRTYARVIDYKTGTKDFDYTDILNGAGLQMLIYLFALHELGGRLQHGDALEPAGVLYLPARKEYPLTEPMPDDVQVAQEHREKRRRKGLIRSDENLLAAMEENPQEPKFMPYKVGKSGVCGDLADQGQMQLLERHVVRTVQNMVDQMAGGQVQPNPMVRGPHSPCRYCDYRLVCHKDLGTQQVRNLAETPAKMFWEKLEQEEQEHG